MKKFEVHVYYSSFCTYEVEAATEEQAIIKARQFEIEENELLANVENWEEVDIATVIQN